MTKIEILLRSSQTVFTVSDLAVLWQISERKKLWEVIKYYVRKKRLQKVYRGIYVIDPHYSPLELVVNLLPPAYISLETALGIHGINIQYQSDIHAISLTSKVITLPTGSRCVFHQVKDFILFDQTGLQQEKNFLLASPERAICDTFYLHPHFVFDNVHIVNTQKLLEVVTIYHNQSLKKRIEIFANSLEKGDH